LFLDNITLPKNDENKENIEPTSSFHETSGGNVHSILPTSWQQQDSIQENVYDVSPITEQMEEHNKHSEVSIFTFK